MINADLWFVDGWVILPMLVELFACGLLVYTAL